ncbi:MFS transporter [Pararhodobacter aggregans]|uniref:MFS transporter n=1 Tax=Pararhodobacter aggregans TaxID=404875 RepID=UPI003A8CF4DB
MHRTPPHLGTLVLLTALPVLTLNMFLPSLPAMTVALGTDEAGLALAVSGYMIFSAVLQLVIGPVSDRIGRRPVALAALLLYAGASLGAALAQSAGVFIAFRLAQAAIVAGTVMSAAIIRDLYPPSEAAGRMGAVSASMALAPMLGPTIGGILDTYVGWRAVFGLYAALGGAGLLIAFLDLGETKQAGGRKLRLTDYGALLAAPRYWAFALCQAFSLGAFFVFVSGVPFVAHALWDLSPAWIGAGIGSITGGYMLGSAVTARMAPRLGIHRLIVAGRIIPSVALSLALVLFLLGAASPYLMFGATIFVGIGNGLTVANANTGALSVRPDLAGTAASLGGALAVALGALLSWLTLAALAVSASPVVLLGILLGAVLVSLAAGLVAVRLDRAAL